MDLSEYTQPVVPNATYGRVFYTALGHEPEDYSDLKFVDHLWKGIRWVLDNGGNIDYSRDTTQMIRKTESE